MQMNEYQQAAQRTSNTRTFTAKIENGLLGLFGEGGEMADLYKKFRFQGHDYDREHMAKELGDVLWYVAELASGMMITLDEIAKLNIEKLKARYPEGFDPDKSLNRADGDV